MLSTHTEPTAPAPASISHPRQLPHAGREVELLPVRELQVLLDGDCLRTSRTSCYTSAGGSHATVGGHPGAMTRPTPAIRKIPDSCTEAMSVSARAD